MGGMKTNIESRKANRKQQRNLKKKKKRKRIGNDEEEELHVPPKKSNKKEISKPKTSEKEFSTSKKSEDVGSSERYSNLNDDIAAELRKEDEEIANLEAKLGLSSKKEKSRLHKEYAKLEGYGDDFGDFLDDLDGIVDRVSKRNNDDILTDSEDDSLMERFSEEEEVDFDDEDENNSYSNSSSNDDDRNNEESSSRSSEKDSSKEEESDEISEQQLSDNYETNDEQGEKNLKKNEKEVSDHYSSATYQPKDGEDIYGRQKTSSSGTASSKYVPPHLRKEENNSSSEDRKEKLKLLQRSLNTILNRLSEDTMISVSQSLSGLYSSNYSTSDVNEHIWKIIELSILDKPILMEAIIPVYVATLSGVHFQTGDTVQLGGYLIEQFVTKLWKIRNDNEESEEEEYGKQSSNILLCICYSYNFGMIHSVFMFDMIRTFIDSFTELDIELLLLIVSHSGHSLRSDDPSALKEIIFAVEKKKKKKEENLASSSPLSSRTEFMLSSLMDLKNNKRRKKDSVYGERTSKLRKFLGRMKSDSARSSSSSADSSCLRMRLQDILDVNTKGRWWKVGASWIGNQFRNHEENEEEIDDNKTSSILPKDEDDEDEEELLKLATKCRMNTDIRRSIFCIVMGSTDCDDAFEKLVRSGMLKNRTERDCVRVLMECCGSEQRYNPYYSHLANRLCTYQPQCKFSFQLAFWDVFKRFGNEKDIGHRKSANLAKLLYHLVAVQQNLKLSGVLKTIDTSNLEETAMIFLTIFFSCIFESIEDPDKIKHLIGGLTKKKKNDNDDDDDDGNQFKENLSVFFLQTLKFSPKNKKKSLFRSNLKVAIKACETNSFE